MQGERRGQASLVLCRAAGKGAFYIDQLVDLCVKCLLQKAVHAPCSLCWLHKWGGLQAQLLHIAPGNARGSDVALIKVSRSVRAACIMRGNAPLGVKGINGLRAFGAWHFCAGAKMPNVSIAVYVPPGRCPGLWATFGLTARPNHLPGICANWFIFMHLRLRLGIVQASLASALALHKRSYEKRGISHIFHRKNVRFCTFSIGKQRFRGYGGRCLQ